MSIKQYSNDNNQCLINIWKNTCRNNWFGSLKQDWIVNEVINKTHLDFVTSNQIIDYYQEWIFRHDGQGRYFDLNKINDINNINKQDIQQEILIQIFDQCLLKKDLNLTNDYVSCKGNKTFKTTFMIK